MSHQFMWYLSRTSRENAPLGYKIAWSLAMCSMAILLGLLCAILDIAEAPTWAHVALWVASVALIVDAGLYTILPGVVMESCKQVTRACEEASRWPKSVAESLKLTNGIAVFLACATFAGFAHLMMMPVYSNPPDRFILWVMGSLLMILICIPGGHHVVNASLLPWKSYGIRLNIQANLTELLDEAPEEEGYW